MAASRHLSAAVLVLTVAALGTPSCVLAQTPEGPAEAGALRLRVTDPRLASALSRLLAGSPTADAVVAALSRSGLPVWVGTPAELAESSDGTETSALLPDASGLASAGELQLAWVALRVAMPEGAPEGALGMVERAWVVVDVERIAWLVRSQGLHDPEARIDDDLTVSLAHELVAHVGSVALSRRVEDFCDDPAPGATEGALACSLRVENSVRSELNRNLSLHGARKLPERRSYAVDAMNFARSGR